MNQNEKPAQKFYAGWRTTQQTFLKKSSVKIPAIRRQWKPIFIFPIISLDTLSCHSNQSTYGKAIKNNNFVEANIMNNSAKVQELIF